MAKPSLRLSDEGQVLAKQALKLLGLTKKELGESVGCSRQPVTNFFKGVAVAQSLFMLLCDRLEIEWQTVAGLTHAGAAIKADAGVGSLSAMAAPFHPKIAPGSVPPTAESPIDQLVQQLRQTAKDSLKERCGTMRVLDMSHPVGLSDIYTSVNILKEVSSYQRRRLKDLVADANAGNFDRLGFGQVSQPRVPVMKAVADHKKLIVLGKPGAGKTTFLKHLAMQCIEGRFEPTRLPLFVNLKQFAENPSRLGLLAFISQRHFKSQITSLERGEVEAQLKRLKQVLNAGQALILLDGLDEVNQAAHDWVLRDIRVVSEEFHGNHFLMTCRIAAWEYTFEQFTEVEIADFGPEQVQAFAKQWFEGKVVRSHTFLRHLAQQPRLAELASTPLLLTLLCLAFEASGTLPSSRSELYREGLETLLKKWDASRGIHRDQVYKKLSVKRKEDLLSQIALTTFEQGQYFFRQRDVEAYITDYIRNLPEASEDTTVLSLDSSAMLQSLEAQHGLLVERVKYYYSFSHLTFHEYFVARELVLNSDNLPQTMAELVNRYALNPQWREVFLLSSELLRNADLLLAPLTVKVQSLLIEFPRLQDFLAEAVQRASHEIFAEFKPAAMRAFWFDADFNIDENRAVAIRLDPTVNWLVCASFLVRMLEGVTLKHAIAIVKEYDSQLSDPAQAIVQAQSANDAMLIALKIALASEALASEAVEKLKALCDRLPAIEADEEDIKAVADDARSIAKRRHHIGQEWRFTADEMTLLKQYYRTMSLLVDCLYSDGCMLSPQRRQVIENTLFTPMAG